MAQALSIGFWCSLLLAGDAAPPVTVFLDFEKQPSAATLADMEREVATILAPSGVRLAWRLLDEPRVNESFADLVVVRFKGTCESAAASYFSELGPYGEGAALASTKISDGHVLPFSEVRCDQIRRYIGPRDGILGRAMGRVVAHELYHIFAGTVKHGSDGVARSFQTRKELVSDDFALHPKDSVKLRELKWRALMAGEAHLPDDPAK